MGGSVHIIKKAEALLLASKETGLEVTAEKTKYVYIVMPRGQYAGQNYYEESDNHSSEEWKNSNTWEQTQRSKFHSGRN